MGASIKIKSKDVIYLKKYGIVGFVMFRLPSGFRTEAEYHKNFLSLRKDMGIIIDFHLIGKTNKKNRYLVQYMNDFLSELSEKSEIFKRFSMYASIAFGLENIYVKNIEKCFDDNLKNQVTSLQIEKCVVNKENNIEYFNSLKYLHLVESCIPNMNAFKKCTATNLYMKKCYLKYNISSIGTLSNLTAIEIVNTNLNNTINFLFCCSKAKIEKITLNGVGSFSLIPLLAIKNNLKYLDIRHNIIYDLDVINDLRLEFIEIPYHMYEKELLTKIKGLSQRTKRIKSILVTDKSEFFKLVNNSKAVYDLNINLITDGYIDLNVDNYYKKIVKESLFYPVEEIVDHRGISFTPPF